MISVNSLKPVRIVLRLFCSLAIWLARRSSSVSRSRILLSWGSSTFVLLSWLITDVLRFRDGSSSCCCGAGAGADDDDNDEDVCAEGCCGAGGGISYDNFEISTFGLDPST